MTAQDKSYLFVGGCARSGTTALASLLNAHDDVLIGDERYWKVIMRGDLTLEHFAKDEFLSRGKPADSRHSTRSVEKPDVDTAYDAARVIGEKIPKLHMLYDRKHNDVWRRFPNCRLLYIVRNPVSVVESHEQRRLDETDPWDQGAFRALDAWNYSVRSAIKAVEDGVPLMVVTYERLFASRDHARQLLTTLGFSMSGVDHDRIDAIYDTYEEKLRTAPSLRNEDIRMHIAMNADFKSYRQLIKKFCIFRPPRDAAANMTSMVAPETLAHPEQPISIPETESKP